MISQAQIAHIIETNNSQLERAIVHMYNRQTRDEQNTSTTQHDNSVGFNAADASKMSYYARWILSGRHLDGKHLVTARARMRKYTRQLVEISQEVKAKAA